MTDKIVVSGYDKATGQPKSVDLDVTAGSANVKPLNGTGNPPITKERDNVAKPTTDPAVTANVAAVRKKVTFEDADEVTQITIECLKGAGTPARGDGIFYVIDVSDTVADADLTEVDHESNPSGRDFLEIGKSVTIPVYAAGGIDFVNNVHFITAFDSSVTDCHVIVKGE